MNEPTLDCQDCGVVLRVLSTAETAAVARNPERFVVWCRICAKDRLAEVDQ